jgi:hypothetical protein
LTPPSGALSTSYGTLPELLWHRPDTLLVLPRATAMLRDLKVYTVVFPKQGQVTRHPSFLRYPSRSGNKLFLWMPRIFQIHLTSRLALHVSFGLPVGILWYVYVYVKDSLKAQQREGAPGKDDTHTDEELKGTLVPPNGKEVMKELYFTPWMAPSEKWCTAPVESFKAWGGAWWPCCCRPDHVLRHFNFILPHLTCAVIAPPAAASVPIQSD